MLVFNSFGASLLHDADIFRSSPRQNPLACDLRPPIGISSLEGISAMYKYVSERILCVSPHETEENTDDLQSKQYVDEII